MNIKHTLKVSGGLQQDGVVIGNTFDKYGSRNPIVRLMMRSYEIILDNFVTTVKPSRIHEVGCGEGYWTIKWLDKGYNAHGSDFSSIAIDMARSNAHEQQNTAQNFAVKNIYDLDPNIDSADLVVCCQVLEHLENPEKALLALKGIAHPYLILCVPREPLWHVLNIARGKYWSEWGNTPGHIQHWSKLKLIQYLSVHFTIMDVRSPIPWTMVLCKNDKCIDLRNT